ncbi:MAG: FeoA family protein [Promethearchaeati archaeon SRVP18_Atabeyarchaeia-1]
MQRTERYLTELMEGEAGIVVDVETENCPERGKKGARSGVSCVAGCASRWGAVQRLSELGLTLGTEVTMTSSAPLNGSLEVSARGRKIVLGNELASRIVVTETNRDERPSRKNSNEIASKKGVQRRNQNRLPHTRAVQKEIEEYRGIRLD